MDHPLRHLGITMDAFEILEPLFLYLTGFDDTLSDDTAWLTRLHLGELLERYNCHFTVYVYTIH